MSAIIDSLLVYLPSWLGFRCHMRGERGRPIAETREHLSVRRGTVLRVPDRTLMKAASKYPILSDTPLAQGGDSRLVACNKWGSGATTYSASLRLH